MTDEGPAGAATAWWEATRDRRLLLQRCHRCHRAQHHPGPVCRRCGSAELELGAATGPARLYSFTRVHRPPDPDLDAPYVLAIVEVEGARLLTHLVDADPETLACDLPVHLAWRAHPDDAGERRPRHLPVFTMEAGPTDRSEVPR